MSRPYPPRPAAWARDSLADGPARGVRPPPHQKKPPLHTAMLAALQNLRLVNTEHAETHAETHGEKVGEDKERMRIQCVRGSTS